MKPENQDAGRPLNEVSFFKKILSVDDNLEL